MIIFISRHSVGRISNMCVIDQLGKTLGCFGSLSSMCRKCFPGELRGAGAGPSPSMGAKPRGQGGNRLAAAPCLRAAQPACPGLPKTCSPQECGAHGLGIRPRNVPPSLFCHIEGPVGQSRLWLFIYCTRILGTYSLPVSASRVLCSEVLAS